MKVRITDTTFSIPVGESINGKTFDAEKEGNLYTISAKALADINPDAFDKTYGKYHFFPRELEVINETEHIMFKVGDKVRFKKEFYKEEYFKKLPRSTRKIAAELVRQGSFYVFYAGAERVRICNFHGHYDIDASLLEPCKKDVPKPIVKEVSRKAKVGEYIKIVHAVMAGSYYKDGDILKVVRIGGNGVYIECGTVVWLEEYVVLENYVPEEKVIKPHKRKWTPEEIVQAKCFLAEELIHHHCAFTIGRQKTACYNAETYKGAVSKPSPSDEYNEYIGAVVAYCKASGVEIPEFIKH